VKNSSVCGENRTHRARRGSAVDAVVVAVAQGTGAVVLTQDVVDLKALAEGTDPGVVVQRV